MPKAKQGKHNCYRLSMHERTVGYFDRKIDAKDLATAIVARTVRLNYNLADRQKATPIIYAQANPTIEPWFVEGEF